VLQVCIAGVAGDAGRGCVRLTDAYIVAGGDSVRVSDGVGIGMCMGCIVCACRVSVGCVVCNRRFIRGG